MTEITVNDVLDIIGKRAQWMREEGESDMRSILYLVSSIRDKIASGASREEIIGSFDDSEDDEE